MVNKIIYPQEIELWQIIPAIRREMAIEMKKRKIEQKKIASFLGITEPAVSQYFSHKRAVEINFDAGVKKEIRASVNRIIENRKKTMAEIYRIVRLSTIREIICSLHRKSKGIAKNCDICLGNVK
jgi:predicted transcriptional regulator